MAGHIGATWRIRLNRPRVAVMGPFCQITLTTCLVVPEDPESWKYRTVCMVADAEWIIYCFYCKLMILLLNAVTVMHTLGETSLTASFEFSVGFSFARPLTR